MAQVPSTVETIVLACLCIHNLLRDQAPAEQNAMMDKEDDQHNIIPGAWREGAVLDDMQQLAGNYTTKIAKRQRTVGQGEPNTGQKQKYRFTKKLYFYGLNRKIIILDIMCLNLFE